MPPPTLLPQDFNGPLQGKGMAVRQHVVRGGHALGLAEFLPFAFLHFIPAAIKHNQALTGRFPAIHELFEEAALIEQFAFHTI
jgi:hypothetical protein